MRRKSPDRFIRGVYLEYFDRLNRIGSDVVTLRNTARALKVPEPDKQAIEKQIKGLEEEILAFGQNLKESGIDVLERL
ncbi:MAG: hypothetical protein H6862_06505 [Rhodospirillales bacterium]|nr:hypothetical protein [Rhodospirillales bacterium]